MGLLPEMLHDFPEVLVLILRPLVAGKDDVLVVFPLESLEALPRGPLVSHIPRYKLPVSVAENEIEKRG